MASSFGLPTFLLLLLPSILAMSNAESCSAPLQYCVRTCQNVAHMRLYIHQFTPMPTIEHPTNLNRNEDFVIRPNISFVPGFGSTFVHGWIMTNTTSPKDTIVAGFQGTHILSGTGTADNWYYSSNIVFESGSYAGSTLQVMGAENGRTIKQWSIVGGTGKFAMAKGIINHETISDPTSHEVVRELNFHIIYDADYARIAQYGTLRVSQN